VNSFPDSIMLHIAFRRSRRAGLLLLLLMVVLLLAGLLMPRRAASQQAPLTYVYLIGRDTLAVETVEVQGAEAHGTLNFRGQPRTDWIQQRPDRSAGALTLKVYAANALAGAPPVQQYVFTPRGDSVVVEMQANGTTRSQTAASRTGVLPLMGRSVLHIALMSNIARMMNRTTIPMFMAQGGQTMDASIHFVGDTSEFTIAGLSVRTVWADGAPREITVPAQGLRVVRATGPVAPLSPAPVKLDYSAPANAPYSAEQVSIPTTRGYSLAATLTKPKGVAKVPVVITISGSGPQERDSRLAPVPGYAIFREVADTLGRRGIAVLRYDDRGVGESGGRESAAKGTSADFADDVQSVIAWLRKRPDVDAARIAVLGHSEGGLIAPMVAARDKDVKAAVLLAGPAYNGRRILEFQNEYGIRSAPRFTDRQRDSLRAMVPHVLDSIAASVPWMGFFMRYDPLATARTVKQPVLILQGDTDQQVTPEQADSLLATFRSAGNRRVTLRHFPATNHLFLADPSGAPGGYSSLKDVKLRREVLGTLADWLVTTLR
jgi:dienelactone hydrolase